MIIMFLIWLVMIDIKTEYYFVKINIKNKTSNEHDDKDDDLNVKNKIK